MTYFYKFLWVVGFAVLLWAIFRGANRGYFDKASFSKDGARYKFDKSLWDKCFPIAAVLILVAVALLAGCSSGRIAGRAASGALT